MIYFIFVYLRKKTKILNLKVSLWIFTAMHFKQKFTLYNETAQFFYNFGFVYPIKVKTAEPIGPNHRDGSSMVKVKYFS